MSHNQVILLLGTNLGDKNSNIKSAWEHISKRVGEIIKKSDIIETEPVGFDSEHFFLNQAVVVMSRLSPVSLLKEIKSIEKDMGRTYGESDTRYHDRIIDIDILMINNIKFESGQLTIPHHQIESRNFVKLLLRF